MIRQETKVVWVGLFALVLTSLLFFYPDTAVSAAESGIGIWWDILFPALFPFFVISELLLGFGIVHFFGTLFDPLMRPLFRVPGIGGFVMAMGFASGYPVAARLTSQLKEQQLINRVEAERLVSFTSTADPVFLIGAVAVGFFNEPGLAVIFALAHYGGAVILGLLMRFYGPKEYTKEEPRHKNIGGSLIIHAVKEMHKARLKDGRTLGLILQDAVSSSIKLIIVVGGLVVFFSVILQVLSQAHLMDFLVKSVQTVFNLLHIPGALTKATINGIFEVTLGAKAAGQAGGDIDLLYKTAVAAFILSWSGLSVHAQIVSLLTHTDLRYRPFLAARVLHGLLSAVLVFLLWPYFHSPKLQVFESLSVNAAAGFSSPLGRMLHFFSSSVVMMAVLLFALLCLAMLALWIEKSTSR